MEGKDYFSLGDKYFDAGFLRKSFLMVKAGAYRGDVYCQQILGYYYDEGVGTYVNKEKAIYWYRKSARLGDFCSALNLGILYRDQGQFFLAKKWFTRARDLGLEDAEDELDKLKYMRQLSYERRREYNSRSVFAAPFQRRRSIWW
ncbi:hypothetical protein GCM10007860_21400 [Chitiniphilus shinanonensis]|uniref:Sel1 repeat family protein n=1 Tax=Chitiniphilus shinanonensis TaxID=553088 RepID=A0ABQ6BWX1_9NEIS|nr:tetratricopeptide repeat protein [Chitiniphilus shinanonensis]GLS04991.1 hypothetical protein GCM10007860_21400 [Chitiniphilus shinanonensis]